MPWALSYCQDAKRKNGGTLTILSAQSWMAILFSFLDLESPWPGSARQAKAVVQVDLLQCSICWASWAANCYQAASHHDRGKQRSSHLSLLTCHKLQSWIAMWIPKENCCWWSVVIQYLFSMHKVLDKISSTTNTRKDPSLSAQNGK